MTTKNDYFHASTHSTNILVTYLLLKMALRFPTEKMLGQRTMHCHRISCLVFVWSNKQATTIYFSVIICTRLSKNESSKILHCFSRVSGEHDMRDNLHRSFLMVFSYFSTFSRFNACVCRVCVCVCVCVSISFYLLSKTIFWWCCLYLVSISLVFKSDKSNTSRSTIGFANNCRILNLTKTFEKVLKPV